MGGGLLSGMLSRQLLELRAGLFVGSLSRKSIQVIWDAVEQSGSRSAILVYPARNEMGMAIRQCGESRYQIVDFDGLPLMRMVKKEKSAIIETQFAKSNFSTSC